MPRNWQFRDLKKCYKKLSHKKRVDFSSTEIIRIAEIKKYRELFEQSWLHHTIHSEALYIRQCQHQFMTILDAVYPKLLREIYNPPAIFIEEIYNC